MAIKIYPDKIEIGNYTLFEGEGGIEFTGGIIADGFADSISNSSFQGTVSGYTAGGLDVPGATVNTIDKYSLAASANATDVGDLVTPRRSVGGSPSKTHGFLWGGWSGGGGQIDKWPFASDTNATLYATMVTAQQGRKGTSSQTHGYITGGWLAPLGGDAVGRDMERFAFYSDLPSQFVGQLQVGSNSGMGHTSFINATGYHSGGNLLNYPTIPNPVTAIQRYPFSSEVTSKNVGTLSQGRNSGGGTSSTEHGYSAGGDTEPANPSGGWTLIPVNTIDRFPFSTEANASDVGDLSVARTAEGSASGTAHGYASGGRAPPANTTTNVIDRFPFAASANASDVGDLTQARWGQTGSHY